MEDGGYILKKQIENNKHILKKIEALWNKYYSKYLRRWNKKKLETDWWYALKFFLNYSFARGRTSKYSNEYYEFTREALKDFFSINPRKSEESYLRVVNDRKNFCKEPILDLKGGKISRLNVLKHLGFKEVARGNLLIKKLTTSKQIKIKWNNLPYSKEIGLKIDEDIMMVLDILDFISTNNEKKNIYSYIKKKIFGGVSDEAYKELKSIKTISDKITTRIIRDILLINNKKNIANFDFKLVFPVDYTAIRNLAKLLYLHMLDDFDVDFIVNKCKANNVNPLKFATGIWLLCNHSDIFKKFILDKFIKREYKSPSLRKRQKIIISWLRDTYTPYYHFSGAEEDLATEKWEIDLIGKKRFNTKIIKKCKYCDRFFNPVLAKGKMGNIFPEPIGIDEINFCQSCLKSAFLGVYKKKKSKREMIKDLKKLVNALGYIPSSYYFWNPKFTISLPKERLDQVIPCLIEILPFKASQYGPKRMEKNCYKSVFKSWLKALVEAGVLEGNVRKTPRGIMCVAKDGHDCRSLGEKRIDDWLYSNKIKHKIEPKYPKDEGLNPNGLMRADWKVGNVFIEFFGLLGNLDYDSKSERKRKLCKKYNIQLVEISAKELENLDKKLGYLK